MNCGEVVMRPNGLVDSWLVMGPRPGQLMTGLTREATEKLGREWADEAGVRFRIVLSGDEE